MPKILASLRSADLDRVEGEVRALESAGIDGFHLDVMDGRFVPETCFDAAFVARVRSLTTKLVDVHLFVEDPGAWVRDVARAGADRIAFHVEATPDAGEVLEAIERENVRPGLVLFPSTDLKAVTEHLPRLAVVNPLGVDPRSGSGFDEITFERIQRLWQWRRARALSFHVQADGGVWEKTRDDLVRAGADELVGGYPIFSSADYGKAVTALREGRD